jgi:hypothetical protein
MPPAFLLRSEAFAEDLLDAAPGEAPRGSAVDVRRRAASARDLIGAVARGLGRGYKSSHDRIRRAVLAARLRIAAAPVADPGVVPGRVGAGR